LKNNNDYYRNLFPDVESKKLSKEILDESVKLAKDGDEDAYRMILGHLHNYICYLTKEFFIQGAEPKDIYQEGAIKLLNVIQKYDSEKGSFTFFAQSSIRKHIITSINKEQAKKRSILNTSYSLDDETKNQDGETISFMDKVSDLDNTQSSENSYYGYDIIQKDYEEFLVEEISKVLSSMEKKVFVLRFMEGYTYREIAEKLNLTKREKNGDIEYDQKSVDNAIWRSRPKIKKVLEKLNIRQCFLGSDKKKKSKKKKSPKK